MTARLVGYVTVREFDGFRMPVPVQNLVIRTYAHRIGRSYALPQCEHKYPGSYMQLFTTLRDVGEGEHVAMCGAGMLPLGGESRERVFELCQRRRLTIHCVLDGLVLAGPEDVKAFIENRRMAGEVGRADGRAVVEAIRGFQASAAGIAQEDRWRR